MTRITRALARITGIEMERMSFSPTAFIRFTARTAPRLPNAK